MKKYALVESVDGELTLRLLKTFEEVADEVLDNYTAMDMLTEGEQQALENMLGNDYNMSGYFNDQSGRLEIYINKEEETVEAWHSQNYHKDILYVARLFVIEC